MWTTYRYLYYLNTSVRVCCNILGSPPAHTYFLLLPSPRLWTSLTAAVVYAGPCKHHIPLLLFSPPSTTMQCHFFPSAGCLLLPPYLLPARMYCSTAFIMPACARGTFRYYYAFAGLPLWTTYYLQHAAHAFYAQPLPDNIPLPSRTIPLPFRSPTSSHAYHHAPSRGCCCFRTFLPSYSAGFWVLLQVLIYVVCVMSSELPTPPCTHTHALGIVCGVGGWWWCLEWNGTPGGWLWKNYLPPLPFFLHQQNKNKKKNLLPSLMAHAPHTHTHPIISLLSLSSSPPLSLSSLWAFSLSFSPCLSQWRREKEGEGNCSPELPTPRTTYLPHHYSPSSSPYSPLHPVLLEEEDCLWNRPLKWMEGEWETCLSLSPSGQTGDSEQGHLPHILNLYEKEKGALKKSYMENFLSLSLPLSPPFKSAAFWRLVPSSSSRR